MSGEYRFRIGDMDVVDEEVRAKRRANAFLFIAVFLLFVGMILHWDVPMGVAALGSVVGIVYRLYVAVVY